MGVNFIYLKQTFHLGILFIGGMCDLKHFPKTQDNSPVLPIFWTEHWIGLPDGQPVTLVHF